MRPLLPFLLFSLLLICQISPAFAENQTWSDKNFDFKSVSGIYLNEPKYEQDLPEEITQLQMSDEFYTGAAKLKGKEALTAQKLEQKLLRYFAVDHAALAAKAPAQAEETWQRGLTTFSQLQIQPVIQMYRIKKAWQEPYTYTTTNYEEVTIKNNDGKETKITIPKTVEHYVPGRYIYTGHIKVKFDVYATKTGGLVFSYVDYRSAQKELPGMYKRIVANFYGKLHKELK